MTLIQILLIIKEMEKDPEVVQKGAEEKPSLQQQMEQQLQQNLSTPTSLLKKHVYEVYDKIAPHFSHTRYKPWPKIEKFLNQLDQGALVFDVGCGNGKYLGVNPYLFMVGTDRSIGLLKTAQEKCQNYQLFLGDSLYLPTRSDSFDAFISIAVIHHFSTDGQRLRAIRQLVRTIRGGGVGLIYVWAFEQQLQGQESVSKRKFKEQDVFVPWHLHFKYEGDLQKIDHEGCEVDHEKRSVIYKRYYHVFKRGELEALLVQIPFIQIIESYYDRENWCCKIRKLK